MTRQTVASVPGRVPADRDMVWIPAGAFTMGSDDHYPEEAPAHRVRVDGFWIDRHPVTNADFAAFVRATGYVTLAERPADPADYPGAEPALLVPSSTVFRPPAHRVDLRDPYQWWCYVAGADWRHPRGPDTTIDALDEHPVVHVAWPDVKAYAAWSGTSLPTEQEWEYAAGAGADTEYAWGTELTPNGQHMANVWQGDFPAVNVAADGYQWTSPVGAFPPNGYGLCDMIGNVWEWTADWYGAFPRAGAQPACCGLSDLRGATEEGSYDPGPTGVRIPRKVMKGGSYLCAPNYCRRYRPAARMAQGIDTSTCHLGFRGVVRA